MIRVFSSLWLLSVALSACTALEQGQAPTAAAAQTVSAPAKEDLLDCTRKGSVIEAWSCVSKDSADAH